MPNILPEAGTYEYNDTAILRNMAIKKDTNFKCSLSVLLISGTCFL